MPKKRCLGTKREAASLGVIASMPHEGTAFCGPAAMLPAPQLITLATILGLTRSQAVIKPLYNK